MNEQNMLEKFFIDKEDYIDFLVSKKQLTREIEDGTILADLKKEDDCFLFILTWMQDGRFVGDYVKPFQATPDNILIFNNGCNILAERLRIYVETNDVSKVPSIPPAFGILTHIKD